MLYNAICENYLLKTAKTCYESDNGVKRHLASRLITLITIPTAVITSALDVFLEFSALIVLPLSCFKDKVVDCYNDRKIIDSTRGLLRNPYLALLKTIHPAIDITYNGKNVNGIQKEWYDGTGLLASKAWKILDKAGELSEGENCFQRLISARLCVVGFLISTIFLRTIDALIGVFAGSAALVIALFSSDAKRCQNIYNSAVRALEFPALTLDITTALFVFIYPKIVADDKSK